MRNPPIEYTQNNRIHRDRGEGGARNWRNGEISMNGSELKMVSARKFEGRR